MRNLRVIVAGLLTLLLCASAWAQVSEVSPEERRWISGWMILIILLALITVFAGMRWVGYMRMRRLRQEREAVETTEVPALLPEEQMHHDVDAVEKVERAMEERGEKRRQDT